MSALSAFPLAQLAGAEGATWLDRELVAAAPVPLRGAGIGREVRDALTRRRQWLVEQELARRDQDRITYRGDMLRLLQQRELIRPETLTGRPLIDLDRWAGRFRGTNTIVKEC